MTYLRPVRLQRGRRFEPDPRSSAATESLKWTTPSQHASRNATAAATATVFDVHAELVDGG